MSNRGGVAVRPRERQDIAATVGERERTAERGRDPPDERQRERPPPRLAGRALRRVLDGRRLRRLARHDDGHRIARRLARDPDRGSIAARGRDQAIERPLEERAIRSQHDVRGDVDRHLADVRRTPLDGRVGGLPHADRLGAQGDASRVEPLAQEVILDELTHAPDGAQAHRGELLAARAAALLRRDPAEELRAPEGGRERVPHLVRHEAQERSSALLAVAPTLPRLLVGPIRHVSLPPALTPYRLRGVPAQVGSAMIPE